MRKKMIGRCALMLLIAALVLSCLPAFAVDITSDCSVTLHLAAAPAAEMAEDTEQTEETEEETAAPSAADAKEEEIQEELTAAEVQMDIYKIADAASADDSDTYSFSMIAPFESLTIEDEMGTEGAKALAEQAAALAAETTPTATVTKTAGEADVTAEELEAGLYLIMPHTAGDDALTVNTDRFTYTFNPILVSLPTRSSTYTGVVKNSDTGDWIYDADVYLKDKYNVADRLGCFEIEKSFEGLADDGVTVIFDVSVEMYGEPYEEANNVYSMYFADHTVSSGSLLVTGIPVGAVVTVSESYCSAGYGLVGAENTTFTITAAGSTAAESSGTASFTNAKTGLFHPGGSVVNAYTTVESEMDGEYTWQVQQSAGNVTVANAQ